MKFRKIFSGYDIDNITPKTVMEKAEMRFAPRWRKDRIRNSLRKILHTPVII